MDGTISVLINSGVTIGSIAVASWTIRSYIADAKAAGKEAKAAAEDAKTQIVDFHKLCDERHQKVDSEIARLRNDKG